VVDLYLPIHGQRRGTPTRRVENDKCQLGGVSLKNQNENRAE
jgi:hypothetical protein